VALQLVASLIGQLMKKLITEPVIASRVVESAFKLRPTTIEEAVFVNISLNHQRDALIIC